MPEPKQEATKVEETLSEWAEKMQEPKEEPKKEETATVKVYAI
jgi:hypothetical protein